MNNTVKRPISVWISQILLIAYALSIVLSLIYLLFHSIFGAGKVSIADWIVGLAYNLGIVTLVLLAVWGMALRRPFGRWLAVAIFSLIFIVFVWLLLYSGPLLFRRWEYENSFEAPAIFMTVLTLSALSLWLILALAFGKRAKSFFS